MAELSVKIEYASPVRRLALQLMRSTFPIWGLIPVLVGLFCAFKLLLVLSFGVSNGGETVYAVNLLFTSAAVLILSLLIVRFLERSRVLIDKNGIEMPFELAFSGKPRYLSWRDVQRAVVISDSESDSWRRRKLIFFDKSGGSRTINLDRMEAAELEQLLVSIDVFAPQAEQDNSVTDLKEELKQSIREDQHRILGSDTAMAAGITYTELWEEELTRRFRAAAFMPLEVGLIMKDGQLTIVRHLALGGLSAVYLAQLGGGKLVTLKESVVPEDADSELKDKAREMFAREAQFLMRLNHPNIVPVLDYFVNQGRSYLMLDYMSGQDLRQYVRQNGAVRESLALEWALQIARVMLYLHEQKPPILHRDLTPDNLIVRPDGQIVVIDFGAANEFLGNATGTFVGKQSYIAPEQFRGKATTQSDIYAFGGTLYYLLTATDPEALSQSQPDKIRENISPALSTLVKDCTNLEAKDRPATAAQILSRLEEMSKATNTPGAVHNDA